MQSIAAAPLARCPNSTAILVGRGRDSRRNDNGTERITDLDFTHKQNISMLYDMVQVLVSVLAFTFLYKCGRIFLYVMITTIHQPMHVRWISNKELKKWSTIQWISHSFKEQI
jgi:hypothetical protein